MSANKNDNPRINGHDNEPEEDFLIIYLLKAQQKWNFFERLLCL